MIRPKILSDENIEQLLGVVFCQEYSGHIAEWKAVAQAQNDYCYKETCRQIRADILAIDYSSSNPLDYWGKVTRYAEALQGLEG